MSHCDQVPRPQATPTGHAHRARPLATPTLNFHCFGNFMSHCDQVPRPQATPTSHAHRPRPQATPTGHVHWPRPQATPTKLSLYVYTAEVCLLTYFSRIFICGTLYYFMSRIIFADFFMRDIMLLYVPHTIAILVYTQEINKYVQFKSY